MAVCIKTVYDFVNKRSIGLHQIVGQRKGVVTVPVEDTQSREESGSHDRTGYSGPQDRIAVIEQVVWRRTFAGAVKFVAEQLCPIDFGCSPFTIVRIGALDIHVVGFQFIPVTSQFPQQCGLIPDLGLDDLFPKPFFSGSLASICAR